ncbi:MAG: NADH-quinone oxidoreductase subunit A [Phycisphaerales bacterium]
MNTPPLPLAMDTATYIPVMILITMAIAFGLINVVGSRLIGPRRDGQTKSGTYESGMNPIGTARKRFNVRFYLIAMVFLVFDIEIIFLYPWAATFRNLELGTETSTIWFARILFFLFTSVVAYIYAYRKGVFRFD